MSQRVLIKQHAADEAKQEHSIYSSASKEKQYTYMQNHGKMMTNNVLHRSIKRII